LRWFICNMSVKDVCLYIGTIIKYNIMHGSRPQESTAKMISIAATMMRDDVWCFLVFVLRICCDTPMCFLFLYGQERSERAEFYSVINSRLWFVVWTRFIQTQTGLADIFGEYRALEHQGASRQRAVQWPCSYYFDWWTGTLVY